MREDSAEEMSSPTTVLALVKAPLAPRTPDWEPFLVTAGLVVTAEGEEGSALEESAFWVNWEDTLEEPGSCCYWIVTRHLHQKKTL